MTLRIASHQLILQGRHVSIILNGTTRKLLFFERVCWKATTTQEKNTFSFSSTTAPTPSKKNSDNDDDDRQKQRQSQIKWQDWFQNNNEYTQPWENNNIVPLQPLEASKHLDNASRFLLQLLQELYQVNLTHRSDRITTNRCLAIIQQLAANENQENTYETTTTNNMQDNDSFQKTNAPNVTKLALQRARRAHEIVKGMQLFLPIVDASKKDPGRKVPIELPIPNQECYFLVLQLYASKFVHGHGRSIPDLVHHIVYHDMYKQGYQRYNMSSLKPSIVHWNQVLCTWANCNHVERPVHAMALLQKLRNDNNESLNVTVDASSYSHVLRSCVAMRSHQKYFQSSSDESKFYTLSRYVADLIWKDLSGNKQQSPSLLLNSFLFVHYLRTFRTTNNNDKQRQQQEENFKNKDEMVMEIFDLACKLQKVNIHVLQEFCMVASPTLQQEMFIPYDTSISRKWSIDCIELARKLPNEWMKQADGGGSSNKLDW